MIVKNNNFQGSKISINDYIKLYKKRNTNEILKIKKNLQSWLIIRFISICGWWWTWRFGPSIASIIFTFWFLICCWWIITSSLWYRWSWRTNIRFSFKRRIIIISTIWWISTMSWTISITIITHHCWSKSLWRGAH